MLSTQASKLLLSKNILCLTIAIPNFFQFQFVFFTSPFPFPDLHVVSKHASKGKFLLNTHCWPTSWQLKLLRELIFQQVDSDLE
jgi:hypothetical protein